MPDGPPIVSRHEDPYAWLQAHRAILVGSGTAAFDREGLAAYLEEAADEMLSKVSSQFVNLMIKSSR